MLGGTIFLNKRRAPGGGGCVASNDIFLPLVCLKLMRKQIFLNKIK